MSLTRNLFIRSPLSFSRFFSSASSGLQKRLYSSGSEESSTTERRSKFLHEYRHVNRENYLGKDIVASSETEGKVRGSIIYGWINKFLVPEEFLNHSAYLK